MAPYLYGRGEPILSPVSNSQGPEGCPNWAVLYAEPTTDIFTCQPRIDFFTCQPRIDFFTCQLPDQFMQVTSAKQTLTGQVSLKPALMITGLLGGTRCVILM